MKLLSHVLGIVCLILLASCSGGSGGGASGVTSSKIVISADQIETTNLKESLKNEPTYKLDDSEIDLLQKEGIITESDVAQLQAIQ